MVEAVLWPVRVQLPVDPGYWCLLMTWLLQRDNVQHTVKFTQRFPKAKVKKLDILHWPSQSLDLNPLKHVFHLLKARQKIHKQAATESSYSKDLQCILNKVNIWSCPWTPDFQSHYMLKDYVGFNPKMSPEMGG